MKSIVKSKSISASEALARPKIKKTKGVVVTATFTAEKTSTKTKIADSAEELFALRGFYGASLRDITQHARVDLALSMYHFGSKEELFRHVVGRRAKEMCDRAIIALEVAKQKAGERPPGVDAVIEALLTPCFEFLEHGGPGWSNYMRIISNLYSDLEHTRWLAPLDEFYNPTIRMFVEAFQAALPFCAKEKIFWAYYFLNGSIYHLIANTRSIDRISDGVCKSSDLARLRAEMIPFFTSGFYRIASDRLDPLGDNK